MSGGAALVSVGSVDVVRVRNDEGAQVRELVAALDIAWSDTQVAEPMKGQIMATFRRAARTLVNVDG